MTIAVYSGSFDPFTLGHLDIIERSLSCFDQVVVAVSRSDKTFFSLDQRLEMVTAVLSSFEGVSVEPIHGLLVDFAAKHQAQVLVRGLRTVTDFDYEMSMAFMNQQLHDAIQTVFIPASVACAGISSRLVREILANGGDVSSFVPGPILSQLQAG